MKLLKEEIKSLGFRDLAIGYEKPLVERINFDFALGKVAWLSGPSGGGKSTLMKTLAGLINPLNGDFLINGVAVQNLSFEEFLPYRLNIGYSFDQGGLLSNRTLWDNIMLPMLYHKLLPYSEAEQKAEGLVKLFAIDKYRNERPASVPGGVRKAACVARAFVMDPTVLLLDEPTTGLNDEGIEALHVLIGQIKRKGDAVVLFTSRSSQVVQRWADIEIKMTGSLFLARGVQSPDGREAG